MHLRIKTKQNQPYWFRVTSIIILPALLLSGLQTEYEFIKQVLPTITLEEVNAVAKKMESSQGKFALLLSPEKNEAPLPSNSELINLVASAHQLPVEPYKEKSIANSLMDKKPTPGKVVSEKKNTALGYNRSHIKQWYNYYIAAYRF